MADVAQIAKTVIAEIERLLQTKRVVGDAIVAGDTTLIPLVSLGFGFGAGSGTGKAPDKGEGGGGGTGAGGGVRPVAVIVITKEGVRVEPVKRGAAGPLLERVVEAISKSREKGDKKPAEKPSEE